MWENQPRTYRAAYVPAWHFMECDVALLTEQPCLREDPGQED